MLPVLRRLASIRRSGRAPRVEAGCRQAEIGPPWSIRVDFDTLKNDIITVRDRETMKQEWVKMQEIVNCIPAAAKFDIIFTVERLCEDHLYQTREAEDEMAKNH